MTTPSDRLRVFLRDRLASYEQIEVVLLLRSDAARSWTAPEVAAALKTAPEPAAMRLFLLASQGLVVFEPSGIPRYRYAMLDGESEAVMSELAELFTADHEAVRALVAVPSTDPIRSFADAFKLKK